MAPVKKPKTTKTVKIALVDVVREDKTYRVSKRRLERTMQDIDIRMLVTELFTLQTSRMSGALKGSQVIRSATRIVIDGASEEMAVRSRCTTIKMSALQALVDIEELVSHLTKYLMSRYAGQLRSGGFTTITAQKAQIDVYLRLFVEAKKNLEYLMKMATLVSDDIDQGSYAWRRIEDAIESSKKDR